MSFALRILFTKVTIGLITQKVILSVRYECETELKNIRKMLVYRERLALIWKDILIVCLISVSVHFP